MIVPVQNAANCLLPVDRVVINCRTPVVRVTVVTVRCCKLLCAKQRRVLVATLGDLDTSLCMVSLRLPYNENPSFNVYGSFADCAL